MTTFSIAQGRMPLRVLTCAAAQADTSVSINSVRNNCFMTNPPLTKAGLSGADADTPPLMESVNSI